MNLKTQKFYWKKSQQSNADIFIAFLSQLRLRFKDRSLAIILDNASIHGCKKVRAYLKRHPEIKLFHLPTYSPEYNPVELMWKWIKPKVYGFSPVGGIVELEKRFRKLLWHYNHERLNNPIKFNFKAYEKLL